MTYDPRWATQDDLASAIASLHRSLPCTYISGSGTAGTDNTAMAVKSVTLPAGTLTQVGDRLRVRCYVQATAGAPITSTLSLNSVTAATVSLTAANLAVEEAWFHYIDNTHANILETGGAPGATALNVAGFDWDSDQTIAISQNAVVAQHVVVGVMIVDKMPKGT